MPFWGRQLLGGPPDIFSSNLCGRDVSNGERAMGGEQIYFKMDKTGHRKEEPLIGVIWHHH